MPWPQCLSGLTLEAGEKATLDEIVKFRHWFKMKLIAKQEIEKLFHSGKGYKQIEKTYSRSLI